MTGGYIVYEKEWHDLCWVFRKITPTQLRLLQLITEHGSQFDGGWCCLTRKEMADALRLTDRTIGTMLARLRELNMLEEEFTRTQSIRRRIVRNGGNMGGWGESHPGRSIRPGAIISSHSSKISYKNPSAQIGNGPKIEGSRSNSNQEESMPLFDHTPKIKKSPPLDIHFKLAKQLHDALSTMVDMTPRKNAWKQWANDFKLLNERDDIPLKRIQATLNWLCKPDQIRRTITRSGKSFRASFETLEALAMKDHKLAEASHGTELTKVEARIVDMHLSKFHPGISRDSLPEAAKILKQRLERLESIIRKKSDILRHKAERDYTLRIAALLLSSNVFDEILGNMIHRLRNWPEWNGDMRPPCRRLLSESSRELSDWFHRKDIKWSRLWSLFGEHLREG